MKYKVSIGRTAYEYAEIEIEADNEEQAREKADERLDDLDDIEFKPTNADIVILTVEPEGATE